MLAAALDIGGTKTMAGIVDQDGQLLSQRTFATYTPDWQQHFAECLKALRACMDECGAEQPVGLGVNVPGMTDVTRRILRNAVFAGWKDVDVYSYFQQRTSFTNIVVDNDVNSCAIGEYRFGHGDRYKDFVWITVSTGVGGAVFANGQLVRGAWSCAGEVGHLKVEYESPAQCPCGQFGCLESQGSGTAIGRMMKEAAESNCAFAATLAHRQLNADAKACAILASEGDPICKMILKKAAIYIGRGVSYCINLLNPTAVILGGGVATSLPLMIDDIQAVVEKSVISTLQGIEILYTKNGYNAAILGAAALVL